MYLAYICYGYVEEKPVIRFDEPKEWEFKKIIPISFHPLIEWSEKDKI